MLAFIIWQNNNPKTYNPQPQAINPTQQPVPQEIKPAEIFKQLFPTKNLQVTANRPDCFFDKSTITVAKDGEASYRLADVYCLSEIVKKGFLNNGQENLLLVVRYGLYNRLKSNTDEVIFGEGEKYPTSPHVAGIEHVFLAFIDSKTNQLASEVKELSADSILLSYYTCNNGTYILVTKSIAWQGAGETNAELFWLKDNKFESKIIVAEELTPEKGITLTPQTDKIVVNQSVATNQQESHYYDLVWDKNTCNFIKQ
ncbi:MAG: hypothetical protein NTV62_02045 [Candidatus Gribaldobacteria bacterium]|nr:hypothetical protein [Candidatus Gribaldobacteria bacterium]